MRLLSCHSFFSFPKESVLSRQLASSYLENFDGRIGSATFNDLKNRFSDIPPHELGRLTTSYVYSGGDGMGEGDFLQYLSVINQHKQGVKMLRVADKMSEKVEKKLANHLKYLEKLMGEYARVRGERQILLFDMTPGTISPDHLSRWKLHKTITEGDKLMRLAKDEITKDSVDELLFKLGGSREE